jgi:hypothetical protein
MALAVDDDLGEKESATGLRGHCYRSVAGVRFGESAELEDGAISSPFRRPAQTPRLKPTDNCSIRRARERHVLAGCREQSATHHRLERGHLSDPG